MAAEVVRSINSNDGNFAVNQLTKYGWEDGKGLGKKCHGMKNPIKVSVKNNNHGLGLKESEQFVFHWWDHVFNKVADSIKVEESDGEVKVKKEEKSDQITTISNKRPSNVSKGKNLLYGRFVPSGSYNADLTNDVQENEDSSDDEALDFSNNDTLEKVYKLSGGRTAHKAARHGHKLNGKLKRLQHQEKISSYSTSGTSKSSSPEVSNSTDQAFKTECVNKQHYHSSYSVDYDSRDSNQDHSIKTSRKKLKKAKKNKHKVVDGDDVLCENSKDTGCGDSIKKQKKIAKAGDVSETLVEQADVNCKKSKKSKKRRHSHEQVGLGGSEIESKAKSMKRNGVEQNSLTDVNKIKSKKKKSRQDS